MNRFERTYIESGERKIRLLSNAGDLFEAMSPIVKAVSIKHREIKWKIEFRCVCRPVTIIPDNYSCYSVIATSPEYGLKVNYEFAVSEDDRDLAEEYLRFMKLACGDVEVNTAIPA